MLSPLTLKEISKSLRVGHKKFDALKDHEAELVMSLLARLMENECPPMEITFIQRRESNRLDLVVGFSSQKVTNPDIRRAQEVARQMLEDAKGEISLKLEFRGIPKDGEFLLYNSYQALVILTDSPNDAEQFQNIKTAFETALTMEETVCAMPAGLYTGLSLYALRCMEMGYFKRAKACLVQCENVIAAAINKELQLTPECRLPDMIEFIGIMYEKCDEPEKSVEIGLKYINALENDSDKYTLKQKIARWMEQQRTLENAEVELSDIVRFVSKDWGQQAA